MPLAYKIPSHQSIFDVLLSIEVPLNSIVAVVKSSDLDFNSDLSGESVIYEASQIIQSKGGKKPAKEEVLTATYLTNASQNLFDVCLMTLGDLNKIVMLAKANDFTSTNYYPDGVMEVNYSYSDVTDNGFKLALKKEKINITTGTARSVFSDYLLQENGFCILQENGFKILIT